MALCISSQHIFISDGNVVKQIRIDNGQLIRLIVIQSTPQSICISPDEQFLYVAYNTLNLTLPGSPIHKYRVDDSAMMPMNGCKGNRICISNDDKVLFISRDTGNEIQVVNEDGGNIQTIQLNRIVIGGSMCLSRCGNFLFVTDNRHRDRQIHILHVRGEYRILRISDTSYIDPMDSICISSDDAFLFTSNKFNNHIRVLSIEDGSIIRTIQCDRVDKIDNICISEDDQEIFVKSSNSPLVYVCQL